MTSTAAGNPHFVVGRVLRSGIRGFVVASRIPEPDVPVFGSFVKAEIQQGATQLIGLVYDIQIADDPFIRQLALQEEPDQVALADQREMRGIPIEVAVVAVGYRNGTEIFQGLPPQPPILLNRIFVCDDDEVCAFTQRLDFLRLLLNSREVPADELVVSCLRLAVVARPASERRSFLLDSGRELARLMGGDLVRLEALLDRLGRCKVGGVPRGDGSESFPFAPF
jgi:hypothetical protein